jgi:geranyl-CoA carboxylase alpha subunit
LNIHPPVLSQQPARLALAQGERRWEVQLHAAGDAWQVNVRRSDTGSADAGHFALRDVCWDDAHRTAFSVECEGIAETLVLAAQADAVHLFHAGRAWTFERVSEHKSPAAGNASGAVTAPLTGRVVDVAVQQGERVQAGQRLLVLEAMKMEHTLTAPVAGTVAEVCAQAGGQAAKGALLLRIEGQP